MAVLPKRWRVHKGRDPEAELRTLQRRFAAIRRRADRPARVRGTLRFTRAVALTVAGTFVAVFTLISLSPFAPFDTVRHIAAGPNCDAARAVGLAPARQGEPGYWPRHDADNDGVACEPWPR
jgi:hypothetical protein